MTYKRENNSLFLETDSWKPHLIKGQNIKIHNVNNHPSGENRMSSGELPQFDLSTIFFHFHTNVVAKAVPHGNIYITFNQIIEAIIVSITSP